jgi:hypothetical protein
MQKYKVCGGVVVKKIKSILLVLLEGEVFSPFMECIYTQMAVFFLYEDVIYLKMCFYR